MKQHVLVYPLCLLCDEMHAWLLLRFRLQPFFHLEKRKIVDVFETIDIGFWSKSLACVTLFIATMKQFFYTAGTQNQYA